MVREDLGLRIREGEDDGLLGHLGDHLAGDGTGDREADEYIRSDESIGNGARLRLVREFGLVRIELPGATLVDHALPVGKQNVFPGNTEPHVMLRGRYRRGAGAGEDDPHLFYLLADDLERVEQRGAGDDGGAVLIVVKDGDAHRLPQRLLDVETIGSADVFEVDSPDGGLEELAELDHVVRIFGANLQIEHVEIRELLEEIRLALHHGLGGQRADVAEAQDRRAVADYRDEVALSRVLVGVLGGLLDLEAWDRDSGRVGEPEIALIVEWLGRYYRDLSGTAGCVVVEGIFTLH